MGLSQNLKISVAPKTWIFILLAFPLPTNKGSLPKRHTLGPPRMSFPTVLRLRCWPFAAGSPRPRLLGQADHFEVGMQQKDTSKNR